MLDKRIYIRVIVESVAPARTKFVNVHAKLFIFTLI